MELLSTELTIHFYWICEKFCFNIPYDGDDDEDNGGDVGDDV